VHTDEPVDEEYQPEAQDVHAVAPAAEYRPSTHNTQLVDAEAFENLPAEQIVQVDDPETEAYVPAGQFVHEDEAAVAYVPPTHERQDTVPAVPAGQTRPIFPIVEEGVHWDDDVDATNEVWPEAHEVHAEDPVALV
jgi:hypothetical protein